MRSSRHFSRHAARAFPQLDVISIADAIRNAPTAQAAWDDVAGTLRKHGLTRAALHADLPRDAPNPFSKTAGGTLFGPIWNDAHDRRVRDYKGNIRNARARDLRHIRPTLMYLSNFRGPLWIEHRKVLDRDPQTGFAPLCRTMIEEFGQHQALALPLTDPVDGTISMLSFWGDEPRRDLPDFLRANLAALHMSGMHFYAMWRSRWRTGSTEGPLVSLSDRERQTLELLSKGAQVSEIAEGLKISERSVHEYVARARQKLGARSRSEAIALAVLRGIIGP